MRPPPPPEEDPEKRLRLKSGDSEAFADFFREHQPGILNYLYPLSGGNATLSEDVSQEVFMNFCPPQGVRSREAHPAAPADDGAQRVAQRGQARGLPEDLRVEEGRRLPAGPDEELKQIIPMESRFFALPTTSTFAYADASPGTSWIDVPVEGYEAVDRPQTVVGSGQITRETEIAMRKKN